MAFPIRKRQLTEEINVDQIESLVDLWKEVGGTDNLDYLGQLLGSCSQTAKTEVCKIFLQEIYDGANDNEMPDRAEAAKKMAANLHIELKTAIKDESKKHLVQRRIESRRNLRKGLREADDKNLRPSNRPIKLHGEKMTELAEIQKMIEELEAQAGAITSIIASKQELGSQLEQELMVYSREYKDRTMRLGKLVAKINDIPEKKSNTPSWTKFRDWAMGKFQSISKEMYEEAQAILEGSKKVTPGHEEFEFSKEESISLVEAPAFWVKLMAKVKAIAAKISEKLNAFEDEFMEKLAELE